MALIRCPDCETEISDAAPACPRCGRPIASSPTKGSAGNVVAAIASLILPGIGQLAQGRAGAALGWFLLAVIVWVLTLGLFGWIVNLLAAGEAALWNPRPAPPKISEHDWGI